MFHVVLVEPEIPNNTGNIGRTCLATGSALHLVHPLGFQTDEKALRRAGMDYWPRVDCTEHASWHDYRAAHLDPVGSPRHWFLTTKVTRCIWDAPITPGDRFVFGKESKGLGEAIIARHADHALTVPMMPGERSLNLGSCVALVLYEALRRAHASGAFELVDDARISLPGERVNAPRA